MEITNASWVNLVIVSITGIIIILGQFKKNPFFSINAKYTGAILGGLTVTIFFTAIKLSNPLYVIVGCLLLLIIVLKMKKDAFLVIPSWIKKIYQWISKKPLKIVALILVIVGLIFINNLHELFLSIRSWFRWVAVLILFFGVILLLRVFYKKNIKNVIFSLLQLYILFYIYKSFESVVETFPQLNNPDFYLSTKILMFIYLLLLFILYGMLIKKLE